VRTLACRRQSVVAIVLTNAALERYLHFHVSRIDAECFAFQTPYRHVRWRCGLGLWFSKLAAQGLASDVDLEAVGEQQARLKSAQSCFAFDSKMGASGCVKPAIACGDAPPPSHFLNPENARIPYSELREFAPVGEPLRRYTENRAGRNRTRDLGIMSPQL
jgi:hypothetical protein